MKLARILAVSLIGLTMSCASSPTNDLPLEEQEAALDTPLLHAWGDYHWYKASSSPLQLKLSRNLSPAWWSYLDEASRDWNVSSVLDTTVIQGTANPRRCQPTLGRIEVCNSTYGKNGWLGLASIWLSKGHIVQGIVQVNDSYFNTARYNTVAYRRLVMCQEVGHMFGIGHQDENQTNTNLGSCMDYSSNPAGPPSNEHPNTLDYELLELIYAHNHATVAASSVNVLSETGQPHGHSDDIQRIGRDEYIVTHILRADD